MTKKTRGWLVAVVIIVAILAVWYWYMKMFPVQSNITPLTGTSVPAVAGQVIMENNEFIPSTITVKVGEKVTWVNNDAYNHWVMSNDGTFDSGSMAPASKFSFTFKKAGTYPYICKIHTFMTGTVVVTK